MATTQNNGGPLRLVVNNDPGYRVKSIEQRVIEKQKERIELIEKINQQQLQNQKKRYLKIGKVAALIVAGTMAAYAYRYNWKDAPKEIVPLEKDLNGDNVPDAYILQQDGHKIPMYGVRLDNGIIVYKNAGYMERKQNNIIDYNSIEERLNEQ